jgi:gas vesicle protein
MFSGRNKSNKINVIINNLKEEYLENIKYENINIETNKLKEYINRLQNLLKEENIKKYKENELDKIVKLYFYLLNNIKKVKVYQLCYIEYLLRNFQIVIEETYNFFKFKLQQDALSFIIKSYEEILDFYYIVKLRMSDDNIDKFKQLNKDQILKNLNDKEEETINNIKELFKKKKKRIFEIIKSCPSNQYSFQTMIENNNIYFEDLKDDVKKESKSFGQFLKKENKKIIEQLNLEELENKKKDFEKEMQKIRGLTISENVNSSSSSYVQTHISYHEESYQKRVFLFFKKTYYRTVSETVYEHDNTIKKYKETIEYFFRNAENKSIENVKDNKKEIYNNIKSIFEKFNDSLGGFKNNIDKLKEYIDDMEKFIYKQTGVKS